MTARVLQAPLPWQCFLLCRLAGLLAAARPLPSFLFLLILLFADERLRPAPPWSGEALRRGVARLLVCLLLWITGWCEAAWLLRPPPSPSWLPGLTDTREPPRFRSLRLCGDVAETQGLPDRRLRVMLRDVRPEGESVPPLDGAAAWTWDQPLFRPLPGQRVCLSRALRPVHGFANAAPEEDPLAERGEAMPPRGIELWYRARGAAWTLWSRGGAGQPAADPAYPPDPPALWREALYRDFLSALRLEASDAPDAAAQAKALLPALIFGEREFVSSAVFRQVAGASLAHSLALSGQHLAIAGLLGLLAARLGVLGRPSCCLVRPRRVWTLLCSLPFALLYLWIGNGPPSLVRAACMLTAVSLALCFRHALERFPPTAALAPRSGWDALCLALLVMTTLSPLCVYDMGLQLSALCVGALCALPPLLSRILPLADEERGGAPSRFGRRILRGALHILVASLAIQTALLPLNILFFSNPGHWFWLNVLWLPVLGLLVMPAAFFGLFCVACGWSWLAEQALHLASLPGGLLLDALGGLDAAGALAAPPLLHPHWTAVPAVGLLFAVALVSVGRERLPRAARRLALAGALLLCCGPLLRLHEQIVAARTDEVRLDLLDVGQGQAVLLTLPDGSRWLIDGGGSISPRFDPGAALVFPAICDNEPPRLAAVVNSHPDLDHAGGLFFLLERLEPPLLAHNGREGRGRVGERWRKAREPWRLAGTERTLVAGDALPLGDPAWGLRLEVLSPPAEAEGLSANDASLILRLTRRGRGLALLPGDAELPALRSLLRRGADLSAEALVLPHHGAAGSFLAGLYRAVRPRLALASCGFGNRYGYPARKIRAWFETRGVPVLDTGRLGRLRVVWRDGEPARVWSARAP